MKLKLLLLFMFCYSLNTYACLDARQHKLFPIGAIDGTIIFIEAHIHRTDDNEKNDSDRFKVKVKWQIKSYISIYDTSQNLISKTEIDTEEIKGSSYLPLLQSSYNRGFLEIKSIYKDIDYFKTDYISFCDYQKKCNKLELKSDTLAKKNSFIYKKKDYTITLKENKKDKESVLFTDNLSSYFISSVRIYKTEDIELVIGHLATGHEVSMGWITDDPNKKETENRETIKPRKEYQPDFEFDNLFTAVYQEPLMHHGFGNDFFIVAKK